MSWSIANIDNTVKITKKIASEVYKATEEDGSYSEYFDDVDGVSYDGKLYFNPDHSEFMDFLGDERIQEVLKKAKVKGDVTFGSLDGDNFGLFWGYRFDGNGGMVKLKGKIQWELDKD